MKPINDRFLSKRHLDEDLSKTIFSNENGRYSHVHRGRENGGGNGNINAEDKSFLVYQIDAYSLPK